MLGMHQGKHMHMNMGKQVQSKCVSHYSYHHLELGEVGCGVLPGLAQLRASHTLRELESA